MVHPIRPVNLIAIPLCCIACALVLQSCELMSDGEKDPGKGSTMDFTSAEAMCTDGERLYLTEASPSPLGKVKSVDLSRPLATTVVEGLANPTCIMTDGTYLFWLNNSQLPDGSVHRAGLDGSEPFPLAPGIESPHAIAVNLSYVFFADRRNGLTAINRVPKSGGEVVTLATLPSDIETTLEADESWVYFTAPYDLPGGYIARVPAQGGAVENVLGGLGAPASLALSGNRLCYSELWHGKVSCVMDMSVSWTPMELSRDENLNFSHCPGLLMIDGGAVYYAVSTSGTTDGIRRAIPGFAPLTVVTTEMFATIKGMASIGSSIYWLEHDSIFVFQKTF